MSQRKRSSRPSSDPSASSVGAALLTSVQRALKVVYPLRDDDEILRAANEATRFQLEGVPAALDVFTRQADVKTWGIAVEGSQLVILGPEGEQTAKIRFAAPKRIEACTTLNEVVSSATIYALLHSPIARAVLHLHGYKLAFFTAEPEPSNEGHTRH